MHFVHLESAAETGIGRLQNVANHTTSKQQKQGRTLPVATWCLCTAHSIMCVLCATGEIYRLKSSVSIIIVNLSKKVGFHKISSFGTQAHQQIYANNFPNSQALPSNNESPALTKISEWTPSPVIINKTNPAVAIEPWNLKFHKVNSKTQLPCEIQDHPRYTRNNTSK